MQVPFSDYTRGASLATDLVNTSATVRRTTGEALAGPDDLARFLATHEVTPTALLERAPTAADLRDVHALRDETRCVLGAADEDEAVAGATALVSRAGTSPALIRDDDGRWQWSVRTAPGTSLAAELGALIGMGLLGVIESSGLERFRRCSSPTCEGMFVDTSRGGRRRYCMPDLCGNRVNVANHRARRRGTR